MTTYLGGRRRLHPDARGVDVTLANDLIALGGVSIGNDDNPLPGQLKGGISGGAFYVTGYDGAYLPVHIDGSELLFDISGSEALKLLSDGTLRIRNNKMFTARNAANNADLALIGRNGSNGLVLGSGLTGVLKASSSVVSASGIVNADVDAAAAIAKSKLNLAASIVVGDLASSLYTTGTWSPAIVGDSTPGTHSYSNQDGQYLRIGGVCIAWFQVIMTGKNTSGGAMAGNVYVTLPLTMAASSILGIGVPAAFQSINFATGYTQLTLHVGQGTARCVLFTNGDNVATTPVVAADIANNTAIRGVVIYPV